MPTAFSRPTRAQILARVQADIEGGLPGVSAKPRRRPEAAHARAITGASDAAHGHIARAAEQAIPDQATGDAVLRWAGVFDLQRKPAQLAKGELIFTGSGTVLAGTELVRVQDGWSVLVDADTVVSVSTSVACTATLGGTDGNLEAGETLQFASTVPPGIDPVATVDSPGFSGGTNIESLEDLLERVLDRIQRPPLGGAPGDHAAWAAEVGIVDRAWEYKGTNGVGNPGPGKVAVTFVLEVEGDASDAIIPDNDQVDTVQEYLDARSPAEVIVFAPEPVPLELDIDLGDNDSPAIRDAVRAEIKDMLLRDAKPGGTIFLSRIREAISNAAGEVSHTLISPVADVVMGFGEIATYTDPFP